MNLPQKQHEFHIEEATGLSVFGLLVYSLCGVVLESKSDQLKTVVQEHPTPRPAVYDDFLAFLELPHSVQTGCILLIIMGSVGRLIFSIILLQGAQEKNATKVKIWFVTTLVADLISVPLLIFWMFHSADFVSIIFSGILSYVYGGLCLWVVYSFMEEMRIESISHRPGYKNPSASLFH